MTWCVILKPLVIIPAFNEQSSVGTLVRLLLSQNNATVLVVCDASLDETATLAATNGAHVLRMASNLGAWTATQCGLRYALREGYTTVVTMDADGQHRPEDIQTLLAPVIAGDADVVIGSCTHRGFCAISPGDSSQRVGSALRRPDSVVSGRST